VKDDFQRCLFIGGPADGSWISVDTTRNSIRIPEYHSFEKSVFDDTLPDYSIRVCLYARHPFQVHERKWFIYADTALTPERTFEKLLAGYSQ